MFDTLLDENSSFENVILYKTYNLFGIACSFQKRSDIKTKVNDNSILK